jgi:single-strand DNA-binding protein
MSFNKIIIVGNLGKEPELRYTPQGNPVCNFTVATNEKKKDKAGETQDITTWFTVTFWGKQAETAAQYLTKGRPVYIEGRLHIEEWTDKEGKVRQTLKVNGTELQFIGAGNAEGNGAVSQGRKLESAAAVSRGTPVTATGSKQEGWAEPPDDGIDDSDIPF